MPRTKKETRATAPRDDAVEAFFAEMSTRGSIPLLRDVKGTIRFDVASDTGVKRWAVTFQRAKSPFPTAMSRPTPWSTSTARCSTRSPKGGRTPWPPCSEAPWSSPGTSRMVLAFQRFFPGKLGSKGRVPPILEVEQNR